ncbi:Protein of unknown function DUF11 [Indibacter alkaliphilus LW1]|uniref:T9SS type A sorting domain-containing protein n=1 Tax=Indibacter alkaliphilus (strain CCUG 57479 / KCTC 22604 / LW1) TaxID=1189612 RepID=S2E1X4_INDAL|nr:T9SS type A sorting domain-containing protein [Indibacter alkaliphilus]EOZ96053.1 Protein of unknown function DUF11 [Indibacter alkaliphilus LW1]
MLTPAFKTFGIYFKQNLKTKLLIAFIFWLGSLLFQSSVGQQLIFVDELERLPDSDPSATITAEVLPGSQGKILYGQIGNQVVRWVDGKPEQLDLPGRILETNADFSLIKGVITNNQRYYVFKDGEISQFNVPESSSFTDLRVEYFSADGSIFIGTARKRIGEITSHSRAVRIQNGNWEILGDDPDESVFANSNVGAVRGENGEIVVGYLNVGGEGRGFRYDDGAFEYFSNQAPIYATVASKNGNAIAGHILNRSIPNYVAFKWYNGKLSVLEELEPGTRYHYSTSISNDGNIVTGYTSKTGDGVIVFIHIEGRGMLRFSEFLNDEYGIQLPGERLISADLSEDQTYVTGELRFTVSNQRSFILILDEKDDRLVVNSTDDRPLNVASATDCNTGRNVQVNGRDVPECTLRAAIQAAINRHQDGEEKSTAITFNIPEEGVKTISLLSPLPEITAPILLDGTGHLTSFGLPLVSLDGSGTSGSCLILKHNDIKVKGFAIHGFAEHGIVLEGLTGIELETLIIGTNANRSPGLGNGGDGIQILGDSKVKIGGASRGRLPLETENFGTNVAILGNGGKGILIHNPANSANTRKKAPGYYQAEWENRNLRIAEEEKNVEVNNATFGMLKFEDIEAYTDPNREEGIEMIGARGMNIGSSSSWEGDAPSISISSSEMVHVVQMSANKNRAVISQPDHINVERAQSSSIKVRGSRGITIGSYDEEDDPIEGVGAGSYFLDVEDSEDVEIHHVLVGAAKSISNLSQSLNNSLRNLEGGIRVHNSRKVKIGRLGMTTVIVNSGGKTGSLGAGIHISGNLSQAIRVVAAKVGATDLGTFGANEGDGILVEDGVADFEIGGESEEETVVLAGNKGYGLVLSKLNEHTVLAEYLTRQIGRVTNVITDALGKPTFGEVISNKLGAVKVDDSFNIMLERLSIGQTDGNGIEIKGDLSKAIKILKTGIGTLAEYEHLLPEEIRGPKGDGIVIDGASNIEIGETNGPSGVNIWGSLGRGISILNAKNIHVHKANIGAFDLSRVTGAAATAAKTIGNAMGGIYVEASENIEVAESEISNNGSNSESQFGGIMVKSANMIKILASELGNRHESGEILGNEKEGILLENARQIKVLSSKIVGNMGGISAAFSDLELDGNTIEAQKSDGVRLGNGISFRGGHLKMIRNVVQENEAVGIQLNAVLGATIRVNNIVANALGGLKSGGENERTLEEGQVFAQENWWGDASGPGGNGSGSGDQVLGNVDYAEWLTSPIGIAVTPESHLIGLESNEELELSVAFANHLLTTDRLNVSIADSLGWIQGSTSFSVDVSDGEKTFQTLSFQPSDSQSSTNKVTITATSEGNPELESASTIYLLGENRIVYLNKDELNGQDHIDLERGNFRIGDELLINSGGANEEKVLIKDFGSIILDEPLKYSHAAGEGAILLTSSITSIGFEPRENTPAILGQNYPNPFTDKTTIPISLPLSSNISFQVFDQMGRLVSTLHKGVLKQGKHYFEWDASDLSPGIYFYRIEGLGFMDTKRMFLKGQ